MNMLDPEMGMIIMEHREHGRISNVDSPPDTHGCFHHCDCIWYSQRLLGDKTQCQIDGKILYLFSSKCKFN